jgi:carbonic anhydrase
MLKRNILVVATSLLLSTTAYPGVTHWSYDGDVGSEHWSELSPDYALCGSGKNQTPIDIDHEIKGKLEPIKFHYVTPVSDVVNNGHTVQANVDPGSSITVDGIEFDLKQFHFHTPSENMVHGKHLDMEMHLVHADKDGNLAVVAVMFKEGKKNAALEHLWKHIPHHEGEHGMPEGKMTAASLLPKSHHYYRFTGSLTTPPCSEGVRWLVMKQPLTASEDQIEDFASSLHGKHNERPMQSIGARMILTDD